MIIIRKPRRKGWSELMLAALKVARTCFANANEAKEDDELEQEKYWVE